MFKKLICILFGHRPWRTIKETVVPPIPDLPPEGFKGSAVTVLEAHALWMKTRRGFTLISLTCDRCATIRTLEH